MRTRAHMRAYICVRVCVCFNECVWVLCIHVRATACYMIIYVMEFRSLVPTCYFVCCVICTEMWCQLHHNLVIFSIITLQHFGLAWVYIYITIVKKMLNAQLTTTVTSKQQSSQETRGEGGIRFYWHYSFNVSLWFKAKFVWLKIPWLLLHQAQQKQVGHSNHIKERIRKKKKKERTSLKWVIIIIHDPVLLSSMTHPDNVNMHKVRKTCQVIKAGGKKSNDELT